MRFLKTLKKAQVERSLALEAEPSFEGSVKSNGLLLDPELKIGIPTDVEFVPQPGTVGNVDEMLWPGPPHRESTAKHLHQRTSDRLVMVDMGDVNRRLIAFTAPGSRLCESYRSLRTNILSAVTKDSINSIVFLSADTAEGKSLTSLNLCWLLAQTEGVKVLLIDADLRRPSLSEYLGLRPEIGLCEVLGGKVSFDEAILNLQPAGLRLLPAGRSAEDVADRIAGAGFKAVVREATSKFDIVIIDTPPLRLFSDASDVVNSVDAAVLVVKSNHISYKDTQRIVELIPRDRLIGVVLNEAEASIAGGSYSDSYYYPHNSA